MGLSQKFIFKYKSVNEIEDFLTEFCNPLQYQHHGKLWIIHEYNGQMMNFELAVEDYGLYTQRSGNYFEVLGLLVENLTGKFGKVEIDDL